MIRLTQASDRSVLYVNPNHILFAEPLIGWTKITLVSGQERHVLQPPGEIQQLILAWVASSAEFAAFGASGVAGHG